MSLTLVVLAAGLGSRFGGLKQLEGVGPAGETVLDYAVFDAVRAGFDRIRFVIRRDFEADFRARVGGRYTGGVPVDYAFQSVDDLPAGVVAPAGRTKPWGTAHAVWCARHGLGGPFAVINADDFYGRDSLARLARFLRGPAGRAAGPVQFATVGFRLAQTLSENGAVARGVCAVAADGALLHVTERTGIRREQVGAGREFSGEEIVSMNCWGFTPALFPWIERGLKTLSSERPDDLTAEYYLPAAVSAMIDAAAAEVRVLPTAATWFGVTYREDKPRVVEAIRALVAGAEYPANLWEAVAS
ncbi:MAG TPA: nucleotidyltransferase [Opitutus sp.]|nr:nucleotidyltransferase [Opitutus sp.]